MKRNFIKIKINNGHILYFLNGHIDYYNNHYRLHREDGPAVIRNYRINSSTLSLEEYWIDGRLHRENGPAMLWSDGYERWAQNGVYHRLDGPALKYSNEEYDWFINGKRIPVKSQEEFERYKKLMVFQ